MIFPCVLRKIGYNEPYVTAQNDRIARLQDGAFINREA